jgi:ABC-type transporter Mla subunit MlaD
VAVILLLATGGPGGKGGTMAVEVELANAPGLARGDPVLVRGAWVGRVENVRLLSPGHVRVTLAVDEAHAPRRDADAQLVALDLVGNQAVQYDPGRAAEPLAPDVPVVGSPSVLFSDRLTQLKDQAAEMLVGLREVDPDALVAEMTRTRQALARAQAVAAAFPADSLATVARATVARGDSLMAALDVVRAAFPRAAIQAQRESLAINAAALLEGVGDVQGTLDLLRERVAAGEGTVGRFAHDSTFRRELDAARSSLRRLLEKFGVRRPAAPPP